MFPRKVVVTGGAGFVGSHLVDALAMHGDEVHVIDDFSAGRFPEQLNTHATYHELDVRDSERITPIISGADVVFHLAAIVSVSQSVEDPLGTHDVNVGGTLAVLDAARQGGAKRFIFMSSAAIYGTNATPPVREDFSYDPVSPYGLHKCIGEQSTRMYGSLYYVPAVILRPFNIYGTRQRGNSPYAGVIARFVENLRQGEPITIEGDGEQTRDFTHVSDVVRALLLASERQEAIGQTINVGSGSSTTIKHIADAVLTACGRADVPVVHAAARVGDIRHSYADVTRAKELLDWGPNMTLNDGLAELVGKQSNT